MDLPRCFFAAGLRFGGEFYDNPTLAGTATWTPSPSNDIAMTRTAISIFNSTQQAYALATATQSMLNIAATATQSALDAVASATALAATP